MRYLPTKVGATQTKCAFAHSHSLINAVHEGGLRLFSCEFIRQALSISSDLLHEIAT